MNQCKDVAFTLTARSIKVYRTRVSSRVVLSLLDLKHDINDINDINDIKIKLNIWYI